MIACNAEATKNFEDAIKYCKLAIVSMKEHTVKTIKAEGGKVDEAIEVAELVKPSIFDSPTVMDLK
jgi:hypothetical protein